MTSTTANLAEQSVKSYHEQFGKLDAKFKLNFYSMFVGPEARGFIEGAGPQLSKEQRQYVDQLGHRKFEAQQCFANAQDVVTSERGTPARVEYWEGYVVSAGLPIPILHAWLTVDGILFDPTREANLRRRVVRMGGKRVKAIGPHIKEPWHYWGIPIDRLLVMKQMLKTETYGSLTDMGLYGAEFWEKHKPKEVTNGK